MFLSNEHDVQDPFGQRYQIYKISFEEFFNFGFNNSCLFRMNWSEFLPNKPSSSIGLDFMYNYSWFDAKNFFMRPSKNVVEFLK